MNVIFFSRRKGSARQFNLSHPITLAVISILGLSLLAGTFVAGLTIGQRSITRVALLNPAAALRAEQQQIADLRMHVQDKVDALAMRLGSMNANIIRLNALGKQLTQMANINSREFDFDHDPPLGGSESDGVGRGAQVPDVTAMIDNLGRRIDARSAQFASLENVILGRQLSAQIKPSGRPVREGYISSYFGERMDPFNGEEAMHKGVDFATDAGADVLAVASGIVTWAGPREGYGNLIEINHGNGYTTRYAHNAQTVVAVGDTVQRGQAIAVVGSTGRSTGPHVHFEVLKDGQQIDPMAYVGR
ncbi:MAG TPA: M23 family metallopeptidase [Steroidobacteraceae bacterium]|jgi:murein DD-endopeptidase MepM/ murein hydrolase activator NlpD